MLPADRILLRHFQAQWARPSMIRYLEETNKKSTPKIRPGFVPLKKALEKKK